MKKLKFSDKKIFVCKKRKIIFLAWKNKKIVSFLNTWNDIGMIVSKRILRGNTKVNIRKPNVIASYTNFIGSPKTYNINNYVKV